MIEHVIGNLLESPAQALVNTVNTEGVMGKGIALQFKKSFPHNYKLYRERCKNGELTIGDLLVVEEENLLLGKKLIINFPTKTSWRKPSEYDYIERGLKTLVDIIHEQHIRSIALPPLGSGNGGLQWPQVKRMIEESFTGVDCIVYLYEPNARVQETLNKERVKLTPARAMLLYMLFRLVKNGEFVSEFASEKLCYFLQRFGAEKYFKLEFNANFYGPYSGKVKHVLNHLNGSYLTGYGGKDKKPFEELNLLMQSEKEILDFIEKDPELKAIVEKTDGFLNGFYSAFALELLSTVDYISRKMDVPDMPQVIAKLTDWSDRKKELFANPKFVELALTELQKANLIAH